MLEIPVIRWGKPYDSFEKKEIRHFVTGEAIATVDQAGSGIVKRDLTKSHLARKCLTAFSPQELVDRTVAAASLFRDATLPMGNGTQSPGEFARAQSATTGLPEHMCRSNMEKNCFVLQNIKQVLDALTRGLDLEILRRGYGDEGRGVTVSYQAQTDALGLVLPSNSPGVHTLWLPVIPLQMGLVLKPGALEPWTPYRMFSAFCEAGIPPEVFSIYPGEGADVGAAVLADSSRCMIFGGEATVQQYEGNPTVQVHGPGYSKIILGDDVVDQWEDYLDLMVQSVLANSGRSCINASGIWASRHTREIAEALADRLGPVEPLPPEDERAQLAAFTNPQMASGTWSMVENDLQESGVTDCTQAFGPRFIEHPGYAYLRPMVVHCRNAEPAIATKEFMFPFVSVVECPQAQMLKKIGRTLVLSAITQDSAFEQELINATHIDRLNLGPVGTIKLDWLQPHEGNLVDFLYRARALQTADTNRRAGSPAVAESSTNTPAS